MIYSAATDAQVNAVVPLFEERYGIEVEVITGGTGELLARIDAEGDAPYCDVIIRRRRVLLFRVQARIPGLRQPRGRQPHRELAAHAGLLHQLQSGQRHPDVQHRPDRRHPDQGL